MSLFVVVVCRCALFVVGCRWYCCVVVMLFDVVARCVFLVVGCWLCFCLFCIVVRFVHPAEASRGLQTASAWLAMTITP